MSKQEYQSVFSPYKRINDRINAIHTSYLKLQRAKDALSKDHRGTQSCDKLEQLNIIRDSADCIRLDAMELMDAVDIQIGRLKGATA